MNESKYHYVLGAYPIWNLCVAHVNPMGWSTLVRLDNPDALLRVSSR